jgi:hypothetical protein
MTLTLTDDELTVLQSALYEYVAHRDPTPEDYVARRYPNENPTWLTHKVADVQYRVSLASALRERLFER